MNKCALPIFIAAAGLLFSAFAAMVEVKTEANLYKNEEREPGEKKLYTARVGEMLTLVKVEEGKDQIMVRTKSGIEGWVTKALVRPVKTKESANLFKMDEAKVQGYLDNPQAVYILDMADPNFKPIKLDRSFADNLSGNIDKENNKRQYDPSLRPEVVSETK